MTDQPPSRNAYVDVRTLPERAPVEYSGHRWEVHSPADRTGDKLLFKAGRGIRVEGGTRVLALPAGTPVAVGRPHPAAAAYNEPCSSEGS